MLAIWLLRTAFAELVALDSQGVAAGQRGLFEFAFPYQNAEISVGRHTSLGVRLSWTGGALPTNCSCCLTCAKQIANVRKTTFTGCAPFPFGANPPALTELIGEGQFWLDARLVSSDDIQLAEAQTVQFSVASRSVESSQVDHQPSLIVDAKALSAVNMLRYAHLVHDTHFRGFPANNRQDLSAAAGVEPYALLAHLAGQLMESTIIDLGTHFGVSAFVLASSHPSNTVLSFDVDDREAAIAQQNKMTREQLRAAAPNVRFKQRNALLDLDVLRTSPLISLDTAHFPDSIPFERELVLALQGIGYRGVVVCDDIYLNEEMARWWRSVRVRKFDVTAIGHGKSGTGIIDFSGRLQVLPP